MELRKREKIKKPSRVGRFDALRNRAKYVTNPRMTKMVASRSKNPAELSKSFLDRVIRKMKDKKNNTAKKREHKLVQQHKASGEIALQRCVSTSLGVVMNNFPHNSMFRCTVNDIYLAIRSAILNHNWSHCLVLFTQLLHLRGLTKRHSVHLLRVIIIAMFNSNVGGDEVEKFLRITLGLVNGETRRKFLRSLFILPEQLRGPRPQRPYGSRKKIKEQADSESVLHDDSNFVEEYL